MKEINSIPVEEHFAPGHRGCPGCGEALAIRHALKASGKNTIVVQATGCAEVFSTPYPQTSWKVPYIHGAFENAASIASGINRALKVQGKRQKVNLLVFGGDGATFDIGFQFISGAFERGENFTYVCLDNSAYMNTGVQRSSATPKYAATSTTPAGKKIMGKQESRKPLALILAAHGAYAATANIAYPQDMINKIQKALLFSGPSYIEVFTPCPTGWNFPSDMSIEIAKMAFKTKAVPLYEIDEGILKFYRKPTNPKPVEEYLKMQGRFKHITLREVRKIQNSIDTQWNRLEQLEAGRVHITLS